MNINVTKVKLIVTVPVDNTEEIIKAMCEAGAGVIGEYSYCSMSTKCTGTFKGSDNSTPYIGTKNEIEYVSEDKVEVQCDIDKVKGVLKVLREVHPYEEVAIDIIPLINEEDL